MKLQDIVQSPNFKKNVIIIFFLFSLLIWSFLSIYSHYYVSTEDAYVGAHVVEIAPRISGQVSKLSVRNNQYVKKGDILFEIDSTPFELAVNSAKAQVNITEAQLQNASLVERRTTTLAKQRFSSPQAEDNAITSLRTAIANLQYAQSGLAQANLNLQYTKIVAPTSGWLTNLSLREGDIVNANQPLFALISDNEFWIDANFKETETTNIKPGQVSAITVDMYPNRSFKGIVESISSGTGAVFSLLPPQNATGNWVKVTQRIPVRIHVINVDKQYPLRMGTSARVTISLHHYSK